MSSRQLSPHIAIALLLIVALLVSPPSSAATSVQGITIVTDKPDYVNVSGLNHVIATVNVTFNGNGPLDPVRFDWYDPGAPTPFITRYVGPVGSTSPVVATDTWDADREGRGFTVTATINTTVGGPVWMQALTTFNVFSRNAFAPVTDIVVRTGSVYENQTVATARADLAWSVNPSYLGDVRFDWYSPDWTLVFTETKPNVTSGFAESNWTIDREGAGFHVNATYVPKPTVTNTTSFDVVPAWVNSRLPPSISGSVTLTEGGGPYWVCDNMTIPVGSELIVQPGTVIRFCRDTGLFVNGTLRVDAPPPAKRVYFLSYERPMRAGDWRGITFYSVASSSSTLFNAVVQGAVAGVTIQGMSVPIVNSTFALTSGPAIYLTSSSSVIGNNTIEGGDIGIRIDTSTGVALEANRIQNTRIGILALDSTIRLSENDLSGTGQVGLQAVRTDVQGYSDTFRDGGEIGIYLSGVPRAVFTEVTISGGNDSLRAENCVDVLLERSTLGGARYRSLVLTNTRATVINTTLASAEWDLQLVSSPTTLVNSTYSRLSTIVNSTLTVRNFLHVLVENNLSQRVAGAWVNVSADGSPVAYRRTNGVGLALWILLTDRVENSSGPRSVTNTVEAAVGGFQVVSSPRSVDMRTSHLERFVALPIVPPPNPVPPGIDPLLLILLAVALGATLVAVPVMRRRKTNGAAAQAHPPPHEVVLEPGTAYLLPDEKPDRAFLILESQLAKAAKGLVVSRIYPDDVRRRYRVKDVPILWLSRGYGKDAVNPTNLGAIIQDVEKFVSGKEDSVVLFDGLEYLLVQNDAQKVVKFVQTLADTASMHHAKVLIPFNTKSVSEVQRALITRDLQTL